MANQLTEETYKQLRENFCAKATAVSNFTNKRITRNDTQTIDTLKLELIESYNKFLEYTGRFISGYTANCQARVNEKFVTNYQPKFVKSLNLLGFEVQVPNLYDLVDTPNIKRINTTESQSRVSSSVDNNSRESSRSSSPILFERETDTNQDNINTESTIMPLSKLEFLNLCARTINSTYSGDPLGLKPLLNAIELLEQMAETDELRTILKTYLLTKLQGNALECLPSNPTAVKDITDALSKAIKPDSSKVVSGRMLALKADKSNFADYAKKTEALAESFKRSLILEGISSEKANEMTIDKTIDLCRANTNSSIVKSVLASTSFETPKDVVAKFIVENN